MKGTSFYLTNKLHTLGIDGRVVVDAGGEWWLVTAHYCEELAASGHPYLSKEQLIGGTYAAACQFLARQYGITLEAEPPLTKSHI